MEQEVIEQEQENFEINISAYDFNEAKEHLKEFAEQSRDELNFDKVRTHDNFLGFDLTEHAVTGKEFNTLVEQTQNYISKFYEKQQEVIEQFSQVYKALEGLDKGYIQAIICNVAAIELNNKKILKEQARIDKTIEKQTSTLLALKQFKEKFNENNHKEAIEEHENRLSRLDDRIVSLEDTVSVLPLEPVSHTSEIEELRKELNESKQQIQFISNRLLTLFIVSGVSIGMLIITLVFMFLR
ncbi:hypothetical protein B7721_07570 [Streptococcus oralis subsp. oralis]|uniref:Uncharacterized protein n=1 Tax=Streptococcus oralis subsp. oralis TaxID=1891914 RepID=A0A1X1H5M4_STROR|nr:hypothetical protein [Streptococcus oralis]ORO54405.1 hypothetical protein B7721_07570 [Streptococcus oralis subsp. oralis]